MPTRKHLTETERAWNIERLQREFDERANREHLRPCKSCNGYAKLDRKSQCVECIDIPVETKQLPTTSFADITISVNDTAKVQYA